MSYGYRIIPAYAGSTLRESDGWVEWTDHPRIRGEHVPTVRAAHVFWGSSPHTRGALQALVHLRSHMGIIPAYAGSTNPGKAACRQEPDHPRIRGEHLESRTSPPDIVGSSPHTRGAHLVQEPVHRLRGIIPAYAGSTRRCPWLSCPGRDHPRIRGEHALCSGISGQATGSSPHTRGARKVVGADIGKGRIIPAYAGSTTIPKGREWTLRDHPRIRGEHGAATAGEAARPGSSPHTRGAPPVPGSRPEARMDHPRIRGEHVQCFVEAFAVGGSSPHTRGAPQHPRPQPGWRGIIPAYAGSTHRAHQRQSDPEDHPRIRGEHSLPAPAGPQLGGSSPHTRGALLVDPVRVRRVGIIPAYAGSTTFSLSGLTV